MARHRLALLEPELAISYWLLAISITKGQKLKAKSQKKSHAYLKKLYICGVIL